MEKSKKVRSSQPQVQKTTPDETLQRYHVDLILQQETQRMLCLRKLTSNFTSREPKASPLQLERPESTHGFAA